MDIFLAILILVGLFVLRFGLPIAIVMGIGMLQQRRQRIVY
jgi:hypothetical protein